MATRSDLEHLEGLDQYKYGFRDPDVSVFKTRKGLDEDVVRQISALKGEPVALDCHIPFEIASHYLYSNSRSHLLSKEAVGSIVIALGLPNGPSEQPAHVEPLPPVFQLHEATIIY